MHYFRNKCIHCNWVFNFNFMFTSQLLHHSPAPNSKEIFSGQCTISEIMDEMWPGRRKSVFLWRPYISCRSIHCNRVFNFNFMFNSQLIHHSPAPSSKEIFSGQCTISEIMDEMWPSRRKSVFLWRLYISCSCVCVHSNWIFSSISCPRSNSYITPLYHAVQKYFLTNALFTKWWMKCGPVGENRYFCDASTYLVAVFIVTEYLTSTLCSTVNWYITPLHQAIKKYFLANALFQNNGWNVAR